jgi:hypothetical protein
VEKKFIVQDGQIAAAISQSSGGNTLPGAGANGSAARRPPPPVNLQVVYLAMVYE